MNSLEPIVREILKRISDGRLFDKEISNQTSWEFTALVAAAFLPEYVTVSWDDMKLGLFEPINGNGADDPKSNYRLKHATLADVKSVVISHAAYRRPQKGTK